MANIARVDFYRADSSSGGKIWGLVSKYLGNSVDGNSYSVFGSVSRFIQEGLVSIKAVNIQSAESLQNLVNSKVRKKYSPYASFYVDLDTGEIKPDYEIDNSHGSLINTAYQTKTSDQKEKVVFSCDSAFNF